MLPALSLMGYYLITGPSDIHELRGDAEILAIGARLGEVPIGILLDRLEEHPEECKCEPAELVEAIRQLRERNPNGNETNW